MKLSRVLMAAALIVTLLAGCGSGGEPADSGDTVLATTYPMYYLTSRLLEGAEQISVELMISDSVSCLHDYTLTTAQMKKIDRADVIVMNGGGLEDFMAAALEGVPGERIIVAEEAADDPHGWLNPQRYQAACVTVSNALIRQYPEANQVLTDNLRVLTAELEGLQAELEGELSGLQSRELITFHDGFAPFAEAFDLTILAAIEEEEGAEASAGELKEICDLIEKHRLPAIFVEKNGSTNAAEIISRETGAQVFTLNTMMDGQTDYFTAMRENVQAVKEALS